MPKTKTVVPVATSKKVVPKSDAKASVASKTKVEKVKTKKAKKEKVTDFICKKHKI